MTRAFRIRILLEETFDDGRSVREEVLREDGCSGFESLVPFEKFSDIYDRMAKLMTEQWADPLDTLVVRRGTFPGFAGSVLDYWDGANWRRNTARAYTKRNAIALAKEFRCEYHSMEYELGKTRRRKLKILGV